MISCLQTVPANRKYPPVCKQDRSTAPLDYTPLPKIRISVHVGAISLPVPKKASPRLEARISL